MNSKSKRKRIMAAIIAILIILAMILGTVVTAFADDTKILTIGADLNEEQKQLILNYLNVNPSNVEVITVTNNDEHLYLDGILPNEKIGTRTYSCCYIEPTTEGGINVKTVNLNYVDSDMIRNALITSGINNANVICLAPKEVSGTGAMVGIFKAYDESNVLELDEEKVQLASEELVVTAQLSDEIQDKEIASFLVEEVKQEVLNNKDNIDTDEILNIIDNSADKMHINITTDQKWKIVGIMLKIAQQDYDVNEIRKNYETTKETIADINQKVDEAKPVLEEIGEFLKITFQKLTGTYQDFTKDDKVFKNITKNLGIIDNTNDNLLGDNTLVTGTDDIMKKGITNKKIDKKEENFFDTIINFFRSLINSKKTEEIAEVPNNNFTDMSLKDMLTFDTVDNTEIVEEDENIKDTKDIEEESVSSNSVLNYVTYDLQKLDENSTTEN